MKDIQRKGDVTMSDNNNIERENVSEHEKSLQQQNNFDEEAIKKLIQSEVDKVRGKYSLELKKKEEELKKVRAEHLTAEEVTRIELEEQKKELEEQRRAFNLEKNKNFAKDSLAKSHLCSDAEKTLKLVDLVMGDSEEEIETKIKYISDVIEDIVKGMYQGLIFVAYLTLQT